MSPEALSREQVDLLRRRAAALARVPKAPRRTETFAAVVFQLGGEVYAIEASTVLEVAVLHELAPLPRARSPLFGLTYWRGAVIAIVDLRAALGVHAPGLTDLSRVIIIDAAPLPFGVLADAARDFIDIDVRAIRPLQTEERTALLRGVLDDATLVIDTQALLRTCAPATAGPETGG
jgi:purine-binding chemotaxis protein CheW